MKKKWYRSKEIKVFLLVLMHCMAALGLLGVMAAALLHNEGISLRDIGNSYVTSEKMTKDLFDITLDIMWGINDEENGPELSEYENGNSNITYVYVDEEKNKVYTNKKGYSELSDYNKYKKYEEVIQEIKDGAAPYIVVYPATDNTQDEKIYVGNMNVWDSNVWIHTIYELSNSKHYVFAIQADDNFPVWDTLAQNRQSYDKLFRWLVWGTAGSVAAAAIILIGLIWLTIAAGRKPGDEEIHLCRFDRWFTEIGAVSVAGVWFVGFLIMADRPTHTDLQELILVEVLGLYSLAFFLIGYLSLVRRIKAKTLWKNSFLRWLITKGKAIFDKSKTAPAKDGTPREKASDILKKSGNLLEKIKILCIRAAKKLRILADLYHRNTGSKVKTTVAAGGLIVFELVIVLFVGRYWYWNPGAALVAFVVFNGGVFIWLLKKAGRRERIMEGLKRITDGELSYKIPLEKLSGEQKIMAECINNIGSGLDAAVEKSIKDERMKTELITNVSHDIKTPLTSIINYVELLKRENFQDEKIRGYLDVLEEKSQRLKVLTEDVVEASKASTGNITFEKVNLDFVEMVNQVIGEFKEKLEEKHLTVMTDLLEEPAVIYADGRRMWRVLENIFNNVAKYAMEGTRVYIQMEKEGAAIVFSLKNISAQPLNIRAEELTERFIRGDVSRNTEGSGLGLSIAKSLTELQGGEFKLYLDGDLFKVTIIFPQAEMKACISDENVVK